MYKIICMSFDGDFQVEAGYNRKGFDTVDAAWAWSNDLGSRWYFYPFHFVVTESLQTVKDTPDNMPSLKGKRVKSVCAEFKRLSELPEMANATAEDFAYSIEFTS